MAAVDVLAPRHDVELAPHVCCGRPLISQGLLDEARDARAANAERLHAAPRAASRSCFLEPAACPPSAKTRRRCCAARRSARRAPSPARACCSRITWNAVPGRPVAAHVADAGRRGSCCTAIAIRRRWACCRRRARCSRGFLRARSSISTRLLRHGRIVRLRDRALRGVASDWRAAAAPRRRER
jgi:hypothetical protein